MGRRTIEELRDQRVKAMTSAERAEYRGGARLGPPGHQGRPRRSAKPARQPESANASWLYECPPAKQRWPASRPAAPAPHLRPCRRPLPSLGLKLTIDLTPAH